MVELLVVVSIIALLIAILLPSLRQARRQAKRIACQTNLRQLAVAWHHYLDDHEGSFLQGNNVRLNYGGLQGSTPKWTVPKPLNLYVDLDPVVHEGGDVFRCPSDRGSSSAGPTHLEYYGTSYHTNVMLVGQNQLSYNPFAAPCREVFKQLNKRLPGIKRSQVANDSRLILMGDHGWYDEWDRGIPCSQRLDWHYQAGLHNVVFLDGHAGFVRIRKGIHVNTDYVTIPFHDLALQAAMTQQEVECD